MKKKDLKLLRASMKDVFISHYFRYFSCFLNFSLTILAKKGSCSATRNRFMQYDYYDLLKVIKEKSRLLYRIFCPTLIIIAYRTGSTIPNYLKNSIQDL